MSDEELRAQVVRIVCDGGYSSIVDLVDSVNIRTLRKQFDWLLEEDQEKDE